MSATKQWQAPVIEKQYTWNASWRSYMDDTSKREENVTKNIAGFYSLPTTI